MNEGLVGQVARYVSEASAETPHTAPTSRLRAAAMRSKLCEIVHNHLRSLRFRLRRKERAMTQQPARRIPQWLTIDLMVIVVSLTIIGVFMAID